MGDRYRIPGGWTVEVLKLADGERLLIRHYGYYIADATARRSPAAGPLAAGWANQRWTLARDPDLVAGRFGVAYTVPGIWYLLRRRGWSCQLRARRAIERDEGAVEVWKTRTWAAPRRSIPCYRHVYLATYR